MRSLMKSAVLAGWLLPSFLFGPTMASAQDCYQHRSGQHIVKDCSGEEVLSCIDSLGRPYKIAVTDDGYWEPIADNDPGCVSSIKGKPHMKNSPPLRGQSDDDVSTDEDNW